MPLFCRRQNAAGTQGRDGLATPGFFINDHFDESHAATGGKILQFPLGFGVLIVVGHNKQPGVRMGEVVYHALDRPFRVDQDRNSSGKYHTPQGYVPVGAVLTEYRHFIRDPDALRPD